MVSDSRKRFHFSRPNRDFRAVLAASCSAALLIYYPGPYHLMPSLNLLGWAELRGQPQTPEMLQQLLCAGPAAVRELGGEFFIEWEGCSARDHFGIVPAPGPAGKVVCHGELVGEVRPGPFGLDVEAAIGEAVLLRSGHGVVALSGGVDSALVAALASLPCLVVGTPGCHDITAATGVARGLGLEIFRRELTEREIEQALPLVLAAIPRITPVDASVGTAMYFVAEAAAEIGHERILCGQGADELFGGYSRYLSSPDLGRELERDFLDLPVQLARDQAISALHHTWFSMPYLDLRVVEAAIAIPPQEKVRDGIRKRPLRAVAARMLPVQVAEADKKAMQYGSGVWKVLQRLARRSGFSSSVSEYLHHVAAAKP